MYIKLILLFIIYSPTIISSQGIDVLFNNTITIDNSTITWSNFNNDISCFPQITTNYDQRLITTVETEQNQISMLTTTAEIQISIDYICIDGSFGVYCNISSEVCDITNPCYNQAICYSNKTLSLGYYCQCVSGFSGYNCEYDNRVCTENTCWNNGTCVEVNTTVSGDLETSFICQCVYGYEGADCELISNMCENITCENNGICISSYLSWTCECLDSSYYSGTYCQYESSALVTKQILSKSFAIVAIISLCCVVGFVIIMDILKYVFKIDPVDRERYRLKMEKEKQEEKKFKKKKKKKNNIFIVNLSTV